MTAPAYVHRARGLYAVDGDTLDVELDLGKYGTSVVLVRARLRLEGVDTPERGAPGYTAARTLTAELTVDRELVVATSKPDKYGRQLAHVTLPDGRDLAAVLLEHELARPYDGGARS